MRQGQQTSVRALFRAMRYPIAAVVFLGLGACSSVPYSEQAILPIRTAKSLHDVWDQNFRFFIGHPTLSAFSVCHNLSCTQVSEVSLSEQQWAPVRALFTPQAASAEAERQQIQQAIALLETVVGQQIGTTGDLARNQLQTSRYGQLDCIDEATNTTVYLRLLESTGLLHWHQTSPMTSRGILSGQAPHNTATLIDTETHQRYAVDAWFQDNGLPPAIIDLSVWRRGWQPGN